MEKETTVVVRFNGVDLDVTGRWWPTGGTEEHFEVHDVTLKGKDESLYALLDGLRALCPGRGNRVEDVMAFLAWEACDACRNKRYEILANAREGALR